MEKNVKAEEKFLIKEIKNTPFSMAIKETNGVKEIKIVCGNNLATMKVFDDEAKAIKYVNLKPYELIGALIVTLLTNYKQEDKQ